MDSYSLESDLAELHLLVSRGESEQTEFKKSTGQRTEAVKTVCAMLNTGGGFVLFGVTNDGTIVGQQVATETLDGLIRERCAGREGRCDTDRRLALTWPASHLVSDREQS